MYPHAIKFPLQLVFILSSFFPLSFLNEAYLFLLQLNLRLINLICNFCARFITSASPLFIFYSWLQTRCAECSTSMLWRQHSCIFLFLLIPRGLEVMCLLQKARFTVSFLIRREVVCLIDNFELHPQQCRKWPMGLNRFLLFATLTSLHTADTELSLFLFC